MVNSSNVWRPLRVWLAVPVTLAVCLGAGSGSLRSEERRTANLAVSHQTGGLPGPIQGQDLTKGWDADDARVRYLLEELITQRFENAQLSIELARARTEAADVKEASRQQSALLAASIAALATRDRQEADSRSEIAHLRQRLRAAQAELQRKLVETRRLAAAYEAADSATVVALENVAALKAQTTARSTDVLERAKQPAELVSAVRVAMPPPSPRQKPTLEATK